MLAYLLTNIMLVMGFCFMGAGVAQSASEARSERWIRGVANLAIAACFFLMAIAAKMIW
jgi:hypothetical protein